MQVQINTCLINNIMLTKIDISECDIIYISYDEPNAEHNWKDLVNKIPWAKRVHGVKGSDAAHKAAANLSETNRFVTIDGDTTVEYSFLDQIVELDDTVVESNTVISWPSLNTINNLMYGNGSVKCWPKQLVLNMKTHELADPDNARAQIDFCWDVNYLAIDKCFSKIHNNATPLQAWRAGFREGVKMSLDQGIKVTNLRDLARGNLNRLLVWMTIGNDIENGKWAILGARQGCYLTHFTDWDYVQVRDFEYLNNYWRENIESLNDSDVHREISRLGNIIDFQVHLPPMMSSDHSKFFKGFDFNPDRQPKSVMSVANDAIYDIVMITYGEANADANWAQLELRFPRAVRIDGIHGIHNAHRYAASLVKTSMFWVVDGDAEIVDNFLFDYIVDSSRHDTVHVWRAKNPVNGLEYGYGGVKLLPTQLTRRLDTTMPDMTTSISNKYKPVFEISNITRFNTDEFSAWRSGFRECCKLASKVVDRQNNDETEARLRVWCNLGKDEAYGTATLSGAIAGCKYGKEHSGNIDALKLINDFEWLKEQFDKGLT